MSEHIGATIGGRWTIDRELGAGGMATVYAATHRNGKRVAIKVLRPELSVLPEIRERFLREGHAANAVGHRGAVSVDDDGVTDDGAAFLVMELLDGETLEDLRLRAGGVLPSVDVLHYAVELLDVLAAAHDKGIVHRDLKPENLFLTRDGVLKVLDFGIARIREGTGSAPGTRAGSVMGTPAFMAPEQARARWDLVDGRTDLWAVGATMFALLSGRLVHEGGTSNEDLALAITTRAPSLATVAPHAPAGVVGLVDRALAPERSERWQSARDMQIAARDLLTLLEAGPSMARTPRGAGAEARGTGTIAAGVLTTEPPMPRARRSPLGVVALVGAIGVLVVGAWALRSGSRAPSVASAAPEREHETSPAEASATASSTAAIAATPPAGRPISVDELPDVAPTVVPSTTASASAPAPKKVPKAPAAAPDPFSKRR